MFLHQVMIEKNIENFFLLFYIEQETKSQLIVFSETSPDSVRKLIKKYLTANFVTINLADKNTREGSADDEVKY